jgi:hypothetical protein
MSARPGRVVADGLVRLRRHLVRMITAMHAEMRMAPARAARTAMPAISHPATPAAVPAVSVLLPVYFALAAIPWLVRAIRTARHTTAGPTFLTRTSLVPFVVLDCSCL